jgi:hypothetical protein
VKKEERGKGKGEVRRVRGVWVRVWQLKWKVYNWLDGEILVKKWERR